MSHIDERTFTLNVEDKFTVKTTINFHDYQDIGGRSTDHICKVVTGDYPQEILDRIKTKIKCSVEILENLFRSEVDDEDNEPLEVYLNMENLTCEQIEKEANELLEGTGLKAIVNSTEECYDSDDMYCDLEMFEAYLVYEKEDESLDDTTTGRYCDLGSVRDEILATAALYGEMTIAIQCERTDRTRARYFAVGKVEDKLFTGMVYGYEGGGCYSFDYLHRQKFIPSDSQYGECWDDDYRETLLCTAVDSEFIRRCNDIIALHLKYDGDAGQYMIRDPKMYEHELMLGFGNHFNTPTYGFTTFDNGTVETYSRSEFMYDALHAKKLARDMAEYHHTTNPEEPSLSFATLVEETMRSLRDDDVYGPIMDDETEEKLRAYLNSIFDEMENRGLSMDEVAFRECDVCTNCGKVLLSDDELYESPISGSLCQCCSVMCDSCDMYFAPKEIATHDDCDLCPSCLEKQIEAEEDVLKKPETFCPMCCYEVEYDPDTSECCDCGSAIPDAIIELQDTVDTLTEQINAFKSNPLYGVFILEGGLIDTTTAFFDYDAAVAFALKSANEKKFLGEDNKQITFKTYDELEEYNRESFVGIEIFIETIDRGVEEVSNVN